MCFVRDVLCDDVWIVFCLCLCFGVVCVRLRVEFALMCIACDWMCGLVCFMCAVLFVLACYFL